MGMGLDATVGDILDKLEGRFGEVESGDDLLARFYGNSKQKPGESISDFGTRLELSLDMVCKRGGLAYEERDHTLRTVFWRNINNDQVREIARHGYREARTYDDLLRIVRSAEQEVIEHSAFKTATPVRKASVKTQQATADGEDLEGERPVEQQSVSASDIAKMTKALQANTLMMSEMKEKIEMLEERQKNFEKKTEQFQPVSTLPSAPVDICYTCGVTSAGGEHLPYLGYIEATMSFPMSVFASEESHDVLVLVAADNNYNVQVPVTTGTNLLSFFMDSGTLTRKQKKIWSMRMSTTGARTCDLLMKRETFVGKKGFLGDVKALCKSPITVKPESDRVVWGRVRDGTPNDEYIVTVEPSMKTPCNIATSPTAEVLTCHKRKSQVPVRISNTTDKPITVRLGDIIGEARAVTWITQPGQNSALASIEDNSDAEQHS
ncbi:uncharacterized protein [Ptychodera flava]|uniref:uncharacterized protein n=1 Tax=Ptychodera flava TaxID=63121 RepID=UPI00396A0FEF